MSYWTLNAFFLAAVVLLAMVTLVARRMPRWSRILVTLAIMLLATAVFDNIMIGIGLVGYNAKLISGVFIWRAPIEDFAYTIAAAVLLPCVWMLAGKRRDDA